MAPPRETVMLGWRNKALEPQPVIGEWNLTVTDGNGFESHFSFHIITGETPAIVGLDVARYALQNNVSNEPFFV